MDWSAAVNGIPLIAVVLGLVEVVKRLGVKDRAAVAVSLGIGVLLGIGYSASLQPITTYSALFAAIIYGLALGIVACGVWDVATRRSQRRAK